MISRICVNGRFLDQPVTGVQRFAIEITRAIDRLLARTVWPETSVLVPRSAAIAGFEALSCRSLKLQTVGLTRGHLWEQAELPRAIGEGVLLNLGNTAPLLRGRRQAVVIHDAGVFDTPDSYSLGFRTLYKALQRGLVQAGARIITVSKFSRSRIAARLGLEPARITVISEGADHILRVASDQEVLRRHRLRPGMFALVVGNRVPHKNIGGLREAAAALQRRDMTIAVAGAFQPGAFREAAAFGFAERRLGRVTDAELRALYQSATCLLFPSRYEGFGLPPVEAMACGCPVIASRGGAVEEICGDSALYADDGRERAMAQAIDHLLDEPGLADIMRRRGLARAAGLSWDAAADALLQVLVQSA